VLSGEAAPNEAAVLALEAMNSLQPEGESFSVSVGGSLLPGEDGPSNFTFEPSAHGYRTQVQVNDVWRGGLRKGTLSTQPMRSTASPLSLSVCSRLAGGFDRAERLPGRYLGACSGQPGSSSVLGGFYSLEELPEGELSGDDIDVDEQQLLDASMMIAQGYTDMYPLPLQPLESEDGSAFTSPQASVSTLASVPIPMSHHVSKSAFEDFHSSSADSDAITPRGEVFQSIQQSYSLLSNALGQNPSEAQDEVAPAA
jgi:hypothetical protein